MNTFRGENAPHRAERACTACRVQKRKCDKLLPTCSLCLSRSWRCDYLQSSRSKHVTTHRHQVHRAQSDISVGYSSAPRHYSEDVVSSPAAVGRTWVTSVDFPAVFFLDPLVFQYHQVQIPPANLISPSFPLRYLGNEADVRKYTSNFFNGVHKWLPTISEQRFSTYLARPLSECRADIACLLLCMRMITWLPSSHSKDPRTDMYLAAKKSFSDMETAGVLSTQSLEAGLVILLYEIGHAMYPSAFLTVGTCARCGYALGLGTKDAVQICRPFTREEHEERRRVWWAIVVLDNLINLSCPNRPLAIQDVKCAESMPIYSDSQQTALANSFDQRKQLRRDCGCFTLVVESTKLLSQVLAHVLKYRLSDDHQQEDEGQRQREEEEEEELQLHRTIDSLINAAEAEAQKWGISIDDQAVISYSAILALYKPYVSLKQGDHVSPDRHGRAKTAIESVSQKVITQCKNILSSSSTDLESMSPFLLYCIYQVAVALVHYKEFLSLSAASEEMKVLTNVLKILDHRWRAAGAYLQILEAQEVMVGG